MSMYSTLWDNNIMTNQQPGLRSSQIAPFTSQPYDTSIQNSSLVEDTKQTPQLAVIEYTDAATWDELIARQLQGHILQSWAWGELKAQFGSRPLRLAVTDGLSVAAAQLLIRPLYGLSVAYVPRGPLFAGKEMLDRVLLQLLRRIARRHRAAFLLLEPNVLEGTPEANHLHSFLQANCLKPTNPLQVRSSIHLDLTPEPSALFAAFSKGHRADVRRAERNGVTVRVGTTLADFETFYAIMEATSLRQKFGIRTRAYYEAAWRLFGDDACLLLAEQNGAAIAAFLVFGWGREAQYMYSGATDAGLKSGANHLLQWQAIQWARQHGCVIYDFWGIPDAIGQMMHAPSDEQEQLEQAAKVHPLYGVYRFKKGWRGQVVRYLPAYVQAYLPPVYWLWQRHQAHGRPQ
jgi:lipid II:glycine glycyltransferase (peptidoglycan interpeptide bridge formation enzyme)